MKWYWFDLDDTLYDFSASSLIALRQLYDAHRLGEVFGDQQRWIDIYHRHNTALWERYNRAEIGQAYLRRQRFTGPLTEAGMSEAEAESLWPALDAEYLDALAATGLLIDGAERVLAELRRRGHKIGILSNGFAGVQSSKIANAGIAPLIDCVVLSDEAGYNKPDRRIFDHALQKSGANAAESVMVGDNPSTDIAGALAAGWQAVLFCPAGKAALQPSGAKVITSLDMLL